MNGIVFRKVERKQKAVVCSQCEALVSTEGMFSHANFHIYGESQVSTEPIKDSTQALREVLQWSEWGQLKGPENTDELWMTLAQVVERNLKERGWKLEKRMPYDDVAPSRPS